MLNKRTWQCHLYVWIKKRHLIRVSWSYMYSTLIAFGFHENFIRWVKLLYTDISSSVIVNNFVSSSFSIQGGVRQGCSLSPLLYSLCFEPVAQMIRGLDEIKGLKLPGSISELKLSMYADDYWDIHIRFFHAAFLLLDRPFWKSIWIKN